MVHLCTGSRFFLRVLLEIFVFLRRVLRRINIALGSYFTSLAYFSKLSFETQLGEPQRYADEEKRAYHYICRGSGVLEKMVGNIPGCRKPVKKWTHTNQINLSWCVPGNKLKRMKSTSFVFGRRGSTFERLSLSPGFDRFG